MADASSTLEDYIGRAEQLLDSDDPAGRTMLFIDVLSDVLPTVLRVSAHPNDESCTYCGDEKVWQMLEQPDLQSPYSIQANATILARLATDLINNSHSSRAFQAVTRAFSR